MAIDQKNAPTDADLAQRMESAQRTIRLPIHFIKSSSFRVIHASGVWYGGDAEKNLHLTFFNERTPIPKTLVLNVNEHGMVVGDDESARETKEGVVRELEVDVILSIQAATELHKTLGENLKSLLGNQHHENK